MRNAMWHIISLPIQSGSEIHTLANSEGFKCKGTRVMDEAHTYGGNY